MLLTITCPICERQSQIDSGNRGQRLRCPYPDCRKPFKMLDNGDVIAVADSREIDEPSGPSPSSLEQLALLQDKPRRRPAAPSAPEPALAPKPLAPKPMDAEPRVVDWHSSPPPMRDWRTEAPPVRGAAAVLDEPEVVDYADDGDQARTTVTATEENPYQAVHSKSGSRVRIVIFVIILLGVIGSAAGGFLLWQQARWNEKALAQRAKDEYGQKLYERDREDLSRIGKQVSRQRQGRPLSIHGRGGVESWASRPVRPPMSSTRAGCWKSSSISTRNTRASRSIVRMSSRPR